MRKFLTASTLTLALCVGAVGTACAQQMGATVEADGNCPSNTPLTPGTNRNVYATSNGAVCTSATFTGSVTVGTVNLTGATTGGNTTKSILVAANTTSVAIDATTGTLYSLSVSNNSATVAYVKLYNLAQGSTTCGTSSPVLRFMVPASTTVTVYESDVGAAFSTAISECTTLGIADNDTTAPGASTYILNATYH